MSWLSSLFRFEDRPQWLPDPAICPHPHLIPRYRNNVALENNQPMGYRCNRCMAELLPRDLRDLPFRDVAVAAGTAAETTTEEAAE